MCVVLALASAGAAVPSTLAAPAAPSRPAAAPPGTPIGGASTATATAPVDIATRVTGVEIARLITGDRVSITHQRGARDIVTLLPGSPHAHKNVARETTPHGIYVIPQLPVAEQARLDPSLFNVSWLAAVAGPRVPVTVTFARGVAPHAVAGLSLSFGSAHATAKGDVVEASYAKDAPGLDPAALAGVAEIALRTPASVQHAAVARPAGTTHTLTVNVKNPQGGAVAVAWSFIENVDDSSRYLETPLVRHGVVTVQVPAGNYAVIVYTARRIAIDREFAVEGDTSVTLDMGRATVKPRVTLPGSVAIDTVLSVARVPESGFAFGLMFDAPHYSMWIQPTSGRVAEGRISSGVSSTFVPAGERGHATYSRVAVTADTRKGVPRSLTFAHQASEFAVITEHLHANGPAGVRDTWVMALARYLSLDSLNYIPAEVPSLRTVWAQPSSKVYYEEALFPNTNDEHWRPTTALYKSRLYRSAGAAPDVDFAHGPVGPGIEGKFDDPYVGQYCMLCRDGDKLYGDIGLFSGAGTAMWGFAGGRAASAWTLSQGGTTLSQGHGQIILHRTMPAEKGRYVLTGTSSPQSGLWRLSTQVTDRWTFATQKGVAVIPILMARYLPPTTLAGRMAPGHTSFRLSFANIGPVSRKVASAAVSFSTDDGTTWTAATLTRLGDDAFRVGYTNPAPGGSPTYVSLRVTGVDTAGFRVTETALRVYRLS